MQPILYKVCSLLPTRVPVAVPAYYSTRTSEGGYIQGSTPAPGLLNSLPLFSRTDLLFSRGAVLVNHFTV